MSSTYLPNDCAAPYGWNHTGDETPQARGRCWDPDAVMPGSLRGGANWDVYERERQAGNLTAMLAVLSFLAALLILSGLGVHRAWVDNHPPRLTCYDQSGSEVTLGANDSLFAKGVKDCRR